MAKKIHIHRFLVNAKSVHNQFYFPNNYKDCHSVLVVGSKVDDLIGVKIGSREILPKEFNARLVAFTGALSRNQIKYPLKLDKTANALVEIDYTRPSESAVYEVALYFEITE